MKNSIRKILLSVFSSMFIASAAAGVTLSQGQMKIAGAESAIPDCVFEMQDGVSLKLGDINGLRFILKMDEEAYTFLKETEDAEFGFIIAPEALMLAANGDYINMPKKIGGAADKAKIYQEDDYYLANGCVTDIKLSNFEYDFVAVSYIKYNGEIRYTEYNNLARNNLYDTVNMAMLNGYAEDVFTSVAYNEWYGSEQFPIVVETNAEYNAVVDIVDEQGINLSACTLAVGSEVTLTDGFDNTGYKPTVLYKSVDDLNKLIEFLPDKITMPDAITLVARIQDAKEMYEAMSDTEREQVVNYAKVESLLPVIEGYDRVYKHDADDGTVVASSVPNYTSSVSGAASTRMDSLYGNVLRVSSAADGRAQLHITNFPSVSRYAKIYFYVKVDTACNLYLSDGVTNDGWGDNWKNNWSVDGFWCNANTWRLVEVNVADGYIGSNFAIGFRADNPGFTFEISDIYGVITEKVMKATGVSFGSLTDAGTHATYGQIYNLTQGWDSATDLGAIGKGQMSAAVATGHNALKFWIYNPVASEVKLYGSCGGHNWAIETLAVLAPQAWTEVVLTSSMVRASEHDSNDLCICVRDLNNNGVARTAGWQISKIYSVFESGIHQQEASLTFGQMTDSGTTNEYGTVYNIIQEQWFIDNNNANTMGSLTTGKLAGALHSGYEYFYFWMYNPTDTVYNFHLAGDCSGAWTDSQDSIPMAAKAWTKITISAADIELNKLGQWYVYILGGNGDGATKAGWQISTIYVGPDTGEILNIEYLDHADVKAAIKAINAIPDDLTVEGAEEAVKAAREAYDALKEAQKSLVNANKLTAAEATLVAIEEANKVVMMIASINPRDLDESLVEAARAAYEDLSEEAKSYVTNLATLEAYEAELATIGALEKEVNNVNTLIANLPDTVIMPDHLIFVSRIEAARDAYSALSDEGKGMVSDYAKLRTLLTAIEGYTTVHVQTVDGVNVIPSHVPNFTSTIGGTASIGYDGYYGNYLIVTPNAGGKAAIQFKNFPDVSKYAKIYFNIRVVNDSCNVYVSDGITNNGWGDNWKNNWSMDGYWANKGNWIQKEVAVHTGMITSNWALGLRTDYTDVSFEITDIVGYCPDYGEVTEAYFGNFTDSGTKNEYGTVYNLTQGWESDADLGAVNKGMLSSWLKEGDDAMRFYIYNPNASAVDFKITGDMNEWAPQGDYLTNLPAKAWTEVILTPEIIAQGDEGTWFVCVSTGAGTAGWQISPIYSFSTEGESSDTITNIQTRINALDATTPNEYQVQLAREAYEALPENEKALVQITNLVACEQALYGEVANAPFIVDGATSYKLYIDQTNTTLNNSIKAAAAFVNEQLQAATGVQALTVETAKPTTITKYRYALVFGHADLYEDLGLSHEAFGEAGYAIERAGRTVFILADSQEGYHMGALAFLREVVGYEMFSEDCVFFNKNGATLPALDLVETPSFEYRQKQTYMTETEVYGMGLQSNKDLWIPSSEGWDMHNTLHYLPTATYQSAHPSWYYTYTDSLGISRTQVCPTAGGSSTEFAAMVQAIADNMMVRINMYPNRENISFSLMDTGDNDDCNCTRCKLYDTLYGEGGFAAAWIDLMNAINVKIRQQIGDRKLNIAFLAYRGTEKAPANDDYSLKQRYVINDDGSYSLQTDANGNPVYLQCDEGVTVWLAPINALYAENLNHADNATHLATIKKWCALSDSVYLWMYGANFKYYMYPYNTWQASAENYKILADLGVKAVWTQSNETEGTAFSDLKGYIDSKFMFDVNADYATVLDTYFTSCFGAGATQMRAMFDQIVARCDEIEAENDGLGRGIYDELEYETGIWLWKEIHSYWTEEELNALVTLCDQAKAAVNADGTLTDAQKTAIISRITKESLFPRYVLCTIYENTSDRATFKADCQALGLTLYKESGGSLSDLFSDWGV